LLCYTREQKETEKKTHRGGETGRVHVVLVRQRDSGAEGQTLADGGEGETDRGEAKQIEATAKQTPAGRGESEFSKERHGWHP
jgi:hypothetical protein